MPTTPVKIKITPDVLRRVFAVNQFKIPDNVDIIFFGIRGAVPERNQYDSTFKYTSEANILLTQYNHLNFRCTMGQWLVKEGKIGLFIGSTVPGKNGMEDALEGKGSVNMLLTGYYTDYQKGVHAPRPVTTHKAFRQTQDHPVRRTKDDMTFETSDPVDFGMQHDNIHSAFTDNISGAPNASHGCQIILGKPKCQKFAADTSAWKIFREKAYSVVQDVFPYILLEGKDYFRYGVDLKAPTNARLRFGSSGSAVKDLQDALIAKGQTALKTTLDAAQKAADDEAAKIAAAKAAKAAAANTTTTPVAPAAPVERVKLVSKFDIPTMRALIDFQKTQGKIDADGIVGPQTAALLGITLPTV